MFRHVFMVLPLAIVVVSCSDGAKFTGSTNEQKAPPEEPAVPIEVQQNSVDVSTKQPVQVGNEIDISTSPPGEIIKKSFKVTQSSGLLDVVWVVDNSGSMENEIEQVRENLDRFILALENVSNAKFALLSKEKEGPITVTIGNSTSTSNSNGYPLKLSDEALAKGHIQQHVEVSSNNALAVFGYALCSGSDPDRLCNEARSGVTAYPHFLKDFFRPESSKVLVVVTDDNAKSFEASQMQALLRNKNINNLTHFSFQGLPESTCPTTTVGSEYQILNRASGGAAFDVCEEDWSDSFSKLTSDIKSLIQSVFDLDQEALSIDSVALDGIKLGADQYQQTGPNTVEVSKEAMKNGKEIVIYYTPKN